MIEIFLPLYDNEGRTFARSEFDDVRHALTDRFGGVTAFTRSPAEGVWKEGGEETHDQIVIFEVMAEQLEREWWAQFRAELERCFRQERLLVRATEIEQL